MMELPNYIPTDNLYKFIAIFGLIILGFSIAFPLKVSNELSLKIMEYSGRVKILDQEIELLRDDVNVLEPEVLQKKRFSKNGKEKYHTLHQEQKRRLRNIMFKKQEIDNQREVIEYLNKNFKLYKIIAKMGMFWSTGLMILGFGSWYWRLQIYQDKIVKKEAEKKLK
ncbi:MAG: hypothetical protein WA066_00775 [Candidatus Omnitrophota bacterium]